MRDNSRRNRRAATYPCHVIPAQAGIQPVCSVPVRAYEETPYGVTTSAGVTYFGHSTSHQGFHGGFKERARGSELLDEPDSDPELTERSFHLMRTVNRIGGGIRVVRRFLTRELAGLPSGQEITILDIGGGDCDIPLAITHWAKRHGHTVRFTCLDHNPRGLEMARKAVARSGCDTVTLEKADVFEYQHPDGFDYAIGSMVFHHFTDDDIDRLIAHLRGFVRRALLINDLHRCRLNYLVAAVLTAPLDGAIRHDALLSIRRGFKPNELARRLSRHDPGATARRAWFCRVAGVVRFDRAIEASTTPTPGKRGHSTFPLLLRPNGGRSKVSPFPEALGKEGE